MTPKSFIAAGRTVSAKCRRCNREFPINLESYVARGLGDLDLRGRIICLGAVGTPAADRPCGSRDIDLTTSPA